MPSFITAEKVGELIAPYIEKSWPNDRDLIFNVIDLIQEQIWSAGLFEGSSKWAKVRVNQNGTIVTPHGYSILLGCKIGNVKLDIRDSYFMFHSNGPTDEPQESNEFSKNVTHLGTYPTLINHLDDAYSNSGDYYIGVVSPCLPPSSIVPLTTVGVKDLNSKPVYTYRFSEKSDPDVIEDDALKNYTPDDVRMEDGIIEGLRFPITNKLIKYCNVRISEVYNITKEPTLSNVDYYALSPENPNSGILIASLDPFQTHSSYNVYRITNKCINKGEAFCLFKRSKPETVVNDSQIVFCNNKTALISLAKGVHYMYFKDNIAIGQTYLATGLQEISKDIEQSNPGVKRNLQIDDWRNKNAKKSFR